MADLAHEAGVCFAEFSESTRDDAREPPRQRSRAPQPARRLGWRRRHPRPVRRLPALGGRRSRRRRHRPGRRPGAGVRRRHLLRRRRARRRGATTDGPLVVLTGLPAALDEDAADRLRAAGVPVLEGFRSGLLAVRHLLDAVARPGPDALDHRPVTDARGRCSRRTASRPLSPVRRRARRACWPPPRRSAGRSCSRRRRPASPTAATCKEWCSTWATRMPRWRRTATSPTASAPT